MRRAIPTRRGPASTISRALLRAAAIGAARRPAMATRAGSVVICRGSTGRAAAALDFATLDSPCRARRRAPLGALARPRRAGLGPRASADPPRRPSPPRGPRRAARASVDSDPRARLPGPSAPHVRRDRLPEARRRGIESDPEQRRARSEVANSHSAAHAAHDRTCASKSACAPRVEAPVERVVEQAHGCGAGGSCRGSTRMGLRRSRSSIRARCRRDRTVPSGRSSSSAISSYERSSKSRSRMISRNSGWQRGQRREEELLALGLDTPPAPDRVQPPARRA